LRTNHPEHPLYPRNGTAYETARVTLKSIFQKTDTHRQAELVALLAQMADTSESRQKVNDPAGQRT
jgi:hypothetical protein